MLATIIDGQQSSFSSQRELLVNIVDVDALPTAAVLRLRVTQGGSSCLCHVSKRLEGSSRLEKNQTIRITRFVVNEIRGTKVIIVLGFEMAMSVERKRRAEANRLIAKKKLKGFGALDEFLAPCLESGCIVECHGVAGSGKSYFAATLAAFALLKSSTNRRVLFVDTDGGTRAADRAIKVVSARVGEGAARRVLISPISSMKQFIDIFQTHLARRSDLFALVVVDSLPDVLRDDGVDKKQVISVIEKSVRATQCPCFIVNQVVADFKSSSHGVLPSHNALVSQLATIRFTLSRQHNFRHLTMTTLRKSERKPLTSPTPTQFRISSSGIIPAAEDDDDDSASFHPST